MNMSLHRPPLPIRRAPLPTTGGAFTSYVRRRGEPDGRNDNSGDIRQQPTNQHIVKNNNLDNNLVNTTDSELSDGYTSYSTKPKSTLPKIGYSSLRGPVKISRPGGGGESDAAFTPSPPVTLQTSENNVSLTLAHQTRIRNLYSNTANISQNANFHLDHQINEMSKLHVQNSHRPDSSSSASSTTDWEGSGHATVLRRANQTNTLPHLGSSIQTLPLVDSLRPLAPINPVYNNLSIGNTNRNNTLESTSSDSEFEKGFEMLPNMKSNQSTQNRPRLISNQQIMVHINLFKFK